MDEASVRAIALRHLASRHRPGVGLDAGGAAGDPGDPARLVPAGPFGAALQELEDRQGAAALRELGHDYARLWARTFRPLVRHLRGRPRDALNLFASEVYPFLRGQARAARIERAGPRDAVVLLAPDLPPAYLEGMVAGFVELTRAEATCRHLGGERFEVSYAVAQADRLAWLGLQFASLRVPFIVAAATAALVGLGIAGATGYTDSLRVAATLIAVLAVQGGANALHHLRTRRPRGPLSPPEPPSAWYRVWMVSGYGVGSLIGLWLAKDAPGLALAGTAGLGLSILYARLHDVGFGPAVAGITYGPLITLGALHALVGWSNPDVHVVGLLASIPLGLLAAALFYVNDLADRPLDEAAGKRSLLVRLPRSGHAAGFALLVGVGLAGLAAVLVVTLSTDALPLILLAAASLAAIRLVQMVQQNVDDPAGLAGARFGALALHAIAGAILLLTALLETQ